MVTLGTWDIYCSITCIRGDNLPGTCESTESGSMDKFTLIIRCDSWIHFKSTSPARRRRVTVQAARTDCATQQQQQYAWMHSPTFQQESMYSWGATDRCRAAIGDSDIAKITPAPQEKSDKNAEYQLSTAVYIMSAKCRLFFLFTVGCQQHAWQAVSERNHRAGSHSPKITAWSAPGVFIDCSDIRVKIRQKWFWLITYKSYVSIFDI